MTSGKNLRLKQDGAVDCSGANGKWAKLVVAPNNGFLRLHAQQGTGGYVAIGQNQIRSGQVRDRFGPLSNHLDCYALDVRGQALTIGCCCLLLSALEIGQRADVTFLRPFLTLQGGPACELVIVPVGPGVFSIAHAHGHGQLAFNPEGNPAFGTMPGDPRGHFRYSMA